MSAVLKRRIVKLNLVPKACVGQYATTRYTVTLVSLSTIWSTTFACLGFANYIQLSNKNQRVLLSLFSAYVLPILVMII